MILEELFKLQQQLDNEIIEKHSLKGQDVFNKKVVAFIVEVSELANEMRTFKFWSFKPASPKEIILEEFSDALHFLLSIGNDINKICNEDLLARNYDNQINFRDFTEEFIKIIKDITTLQNLVSMNKNGYTYGIAAKEFIYEIYVGILERLLTLGNELGFSEENIKTGYYNKHAINLQRQEENY